MTCNSIDWQAFREFIFYKSHFAEKVSELTKSSIIRENISHYSLHIYQNKYNLAPEKRLFLFNYRGA